MTDVSEGIRVECDRIVNRLTTMPLSRVGPELTASVRAACQEIVELTDDPSRPGGVRVPEVGASALGAQVAVVVRDYLDMRTAASKDAAVAELLTQLRRSLP